MISFVPQPFYPREKRPGTHSTRGWVGQYKGLNVKQDLERMMWVLLQQSDVQRSSMQIIKMETTSNTSIIQRHHVFLTVYSDDDRWQDWIE